jgi:hypothetical protein
MAARNSFCREKAQKTQKGNTDVPQFRIPHFFVPLVPFRGESSGISLHESYTFRSAELL